MKFSPQSFGTDWTQDDTRRLLASATSQPTHAQLPQTKGTPMDTWLARSIGGHVAWLMKQGKGSASQLGTWSTPFTQSLAQLRDNPESTPAQVALGRYFLPCVDCLVEEALIGDKTPEQTHESLVEYVKAGDMPLDWLVERCQDTNTVVQYQVKRWEVGVKDVPTLEVSHQRRLDVGRRGPGAGS